MRYVTAMIIVFLFGILAVSSSAATYKWVDEKGRTWITDYPDPRASKDKGHQPESAAEQPQAAEPAPASALEADKDDRAGDIGKVFTIPENIRNQMNAFPQPGVIPAIPASMLAMMSGVIILIAAAGYIYFSICLYFIARKMDVPNPWLAWVPIANMWTFVSAAGKEWWWIAVIAGLFLLTIVPIAGLLFYLAGICATVYLWMCITENLGRNKWLGLLMLVPLVNLVFPAILAFSKGEGRSYPPDITADRG